MLNQSNYSFPLFSHIIAAVHFNNNVYGESKMNEDGTEQVGIVYPKFKNGEATVKSVRVEPNFSKYEKLQ